MADLVGKGLKQGGTPTVTFEGAAGVAGDMDTHTSASADRRAQTLLAVTAVFHAALAGLVRRHAGATGRGRNRWTALTLLTGAFGAIAYALTTRADGCDSD